MKPKEWAAFLGLSIAWGTSFLWIKIAVQEVGPFTMLAIRLLIGAIALGVIAVYRKAAMPKSRQEWWVLVVIGVAVFLLLGFWLGRRTAYY